MIRCLLRTILLAIVVLSLAVVSLSQAQSGRTVKWDEYAFKFASDGQSGQVLNKAGGVIGSIRKVNGEMQVFAATGTDAAKLKKSFADWKIFDARSHSENDTSANLQTPSDQPAEAVTAASTSDAGSPSHTSSAVPVAMTECEGGKDCGTWTFLGKQGSGQWPSGEVASLNVERFDSTSIVIRRADATGSSAGLTATYTGTRHGDRIEGEFTSSWPGHWNTQTGNWHATIGKAALAPPSVMHWCAQHCATWVWFNGRYVGSNVQHPELEPECGVTVESFTRESVIMHRTDCGQYPGKAVLTGKISPQGNTIVNGTIAWTYHPCCGLASGTFNAAWGDAINSIPGSDGPAPTIVARPVVCYPWFFTIVCQ